MSTKIIIKSRLILIDKFTLVELLVVIAIISILAALLMPTLSKALDSARAATCVNVQKQFGGIHLLFTNDNDGRFIGQTVAEPNWVHTFYLLSAYFFNDPNAIPATMSDTVYKRSRSLYCPSRQPPVNRVDYRMNYLYNHLLRGGPEQSNNGFYGWETIAQNNIFAGYNFTGNTVTQRYLSLSIARVEKPAYLALQIEGVRNNQVTCNARWINNSWNALPELTGYDYKTSAPVTSVFVENADSAGYYIYPHLQLDNFLFVDGHVEGMAIGDVSVTYVTRYDPFATRINAFVSRAIASSNE